MFQVLSVHRTRYQNRSLQSRYTIITLPACVRILILNTRYTRSGCFPILYEEGDPVKRQKQNKTKQKKKKKQDGHDGPVTLT